jgi:hypothetical protein
LIVLDGLYLENWVQGPGQSIDGAFVLPSPQSPEQPQPVGFRFVLMFQEPQQRA